MHFGKDFQGWMERGCLACSWWVCFSACVYSPTSRRKSTVTLNKCSWKKSRKFWKPCCTCVKSTCSEGGIKTPTRWAWCCTCCCCCCCCCRFCCGGLMRCCCCCSGCCWIAGFCIWRLWRPASRALRGLFVCIAVGQIDLLPSVVSAADAGTDRVAASALVAMALDGLAARRTSTSEWRGFSEWKWEDEDDDEDKELEAEAEAKVGLKPKDNEAALGELRKKKAVNSGNTLAIWQVVNFIYVAYFVWCPDAAAVDFCGSVVLLLLLPLPLTVAHCQAATPWPNYILRGLRMPLSQQHLLLLHWLLMLTNFRIWHNCVSIACHLQCLPAKKRERQKNVIYHLKFVEKSLQLVRDIYQFWKTTQHFGVFIFGTASKSLFIWNAVK